MTRPLRDWNALPEYIVQARWLIPDSTTLLAPGCLHVRGGCVVRVWEGGAADAIDLGDVAIVPGLINAHTHLEFSDFTEPLGRGLAFPEWIRKVIDARRERPAGYDARGVIARGWAESAEAGTIAVGEIATADESFDTLSALGGRGVVYREVRGLQEEAVPTGLDAARRFLAAGEPARGVGMLLGRGLSPHAPYSLHPALFRGLIELSVAHGAPVAMHVAETREELELLADHRGGLVELLRELRLWRPELFTEYRRPLDYLRQLARCPRALVVHGNYLSDEEIDYLATQPQLSVVYCPRTHAAFGHAPHPWRRLQAQGVRVVLGTDSRASNPDLSLLRELQSLQAQHPDVPTAELLQMATEAAAEALGLGEQLGRLTPGRRALWTAIEPADPLTVTDWSPLLATGARVAD